VAERAVSWIAPAAVLVVVFLGLALLIPAPALAIFPVDLTKDWNLRLDGGSLSENAGGTLANAGDVNGDGVDDMLVGAINASHVYVVYGQPKALRTVLSGSALTGAQGYLIEGPDLSNTGFSVANAGDVNGDGVPDALIGAPVLGDVFVVFGQRSSSPATINVADLGTPGNTQGYVIQAGPVDSFVGSSAAGRGDLNGDGIPDALIGGRSSNHNGRAVSGSAWVVFGQRGSVASVDLGSLTAAQGYRIDGASPGDSLGATAAAAGDVNGDGIPDLLVGADNRTFDGRFGAGSAYLLYGGRSAAAPIDLALVTSGIPYEIGGAVPVQNAGEAVANARDVDGDGVPDALVGAPTFGQAYIVFGQPSGATTVDLAGVGKPGNRQGTLLDAPFSTSAFGIAVDAGDVNGDGIPDAIVGDSGTTSPPGEGYVVFGQRPPPERIATADIGVVPGNRLGFVLLNNGGGPTPANGFSMINAGDLDGDGAADVGMGAPFNSPHPSPSLSAEGSAWTVLSALVLPGAVTGPATGITPSSARLTGTVGTDAVTCASAATPTVSHFEFGPTSAYGTDTPSVTAGLGVGDVAAAADVTGLAPDTYHYRLVAECADGARRFGADRTFTIPPTIADLIDSVEALELPRGIERSLVAKLTVAQRKLDADQLAGACRSLGAFVNQVSAQSGKKITADAAHQLTDEATAVRESLGCGGG
jgi:hypothetical protein